MDSIDPDDLDAAGTEALKAPAPGPQDLGSRGGPSSTCASSRAPIAGRGMFETWLKRSGRYQEMIQRELRDRRLPEDLMWVAMIESGFDPRARVAGGRGRALAVHAGDGRGPTALHVTKHMDQRKNPRLASRAGAHHLRDLYLPLRQLGSRARGLQHGLRAAPRSHRSLRHRRLQRAGAAGGDPSETAAYVPKIAAAAIVANNLEHFGFDKVEIARPVDAAEIAVPPGTPLKTLAKAAGVATSAVRTLNPDILGERVPPGRGSDYVVLIPADTDRARAAARSR